MRHGLLCIAMMITVALLSPLCGFTIGVAAQFNTGNTGQTFASFPGECPQHLSVVNLLLERILRCA